MNDKLAIEPSVAAMPRAAGAPLISCAPASDLIEVAVDAVNMIVNNTLVIRVAPAASPQQKERIRAQVRQYLKARDLERMHTLMVDGDLQLEVVSAEQMARCGWVRTPRTGGYAAMEQGEDETIG